MKGPVWKAPVKGEGIEQRQASTQHKPKRLHTVTKYSPAPSSKHFTWVEKRAASYLVQNSYRNNRMVQQKAIQEGSLPVRFFSRDHCGTNLTAGHGTTTSDSSVSLFTISIQTSSTSLIANIG
ncbi:hypothetical protein, unlikely [Trypanosoma brucei gambiense DAL972]|uniref:Uncharacterized protein n=1 Tax=Trypanosoma brucei gambiense (strain MHOM/CI/86/DAL972) TaxID=679716 RepID=C9ZUD0_TRYB9|nr:hypothetical protein, unlikely [Trypanosoma brucei gambiense DAL972]CBH13017.1 hypothetical protein, unlikely [Trypanosoma brucei gambiense DAL972]|eukprot:XP_011775295.1 hypothetical protein, unlikely [Trypanosoma brucei gambiense DAL972]